MNNRITGLLSCVKEKRHHSLRQDNVPNIAAEFDSEGLSYQRRVSGRLKRLLELEKCVILDKENIVITRTIPYIPEVYSPQDMSRIKEGHFVHESGRVFNISSDFEMVLKKGLKERKEKAQEILKRSRNGDGNKDAGFLESVIETIDSVIAFAGRYAGEARRMGREELAEILEKVPAYGADTFREALQSLRILHFSLWMEGHYHCGLGRFDQYMMPFLDNDLKAGRLNREKAFELVEEFFISLNKDSDLYPGIQQGDNGQSMVLGGVNRQGKDADNLLTIMCLEAGRELKLIDPKINFRVHKGTDQSLIELGTRLTREGLGFPQYENDEVIIPGLIAIGYSPEDARDYAVAACWEFIIPGIGMDIPNIGAVSLLKVVETVVVNSLTSCKTFSELMAEVYIEIEKQVDLLIKQVRHIFIEPAPFQSVLMRGCLQQKRDISLGAEYNNYGFHATGLANAADSLAVIKKFV